LEKEWNQSVEEVKANLLKKEELHQTAKEYIKELVAAI
jgi:hypothetical protein